MILELSHRLFWLEPLTKACSKRFSPILASGISAPGSEVLSLSPSCNPDRLSSIDGLLDSGYPVAVFRRVRTIVITPLYGQSASVTIGDGPGEKCIKAIKPLLAHRDPSGPVPLVSLVLRVIASLFHFVPNTVEGSS